MIFRGKLCCPKGPLHLRHIEPDTSSMKLQLRCFTAALIPGILLALDATRSYASYSEEWLTPGQSRKEEAAHSHHATSAYTCGTRGARCIAVHPRPPSVTGRTGPRRPKTKTATAADPIAAFAKNESALRPSGPANYCIHRLNPPASSASVLPDGVIRKDEKPPVLSLP
jgi:hypothetical protein